MPEASVPTEGAAVEEAAAVGEVEAAAASLMRTVAPLDRGAAASVSDVARVKAAIARLEAAAPPTIDRGAEFELLESIAGRWRLCYSSTFAEGRGGGELAALSQGFTGAPPGLGAVYQDIRFDAAKGEWFLDNLVALSGPTPPLPELRAKLVHRVSATRDELSIQFEETTLRVSGLKGKVSLPGPQRLLRGAQFHLLPAAPEPARNVLEQALGALSDAPQTLASLPFVGEAVAAAERFEREASNVRVTALGAGVRVTRSQLGEVRVFTLDVTSGRPAF